MKIKTDQANSSKYLIFDDKSQRIVTFTIENLELGDSGVYWCSIEKRGSDDGKQFQLSVRRKAESGLSVDSQWKTAYIGGQITISCNYNGSGEKEWCRVGLYSSCIETSGKIDGANVTLEAKAPAFYSVTMSGLRTENSGWYWCAFRDLQIPVFLSITERPTTTALATTVETITSTTTTTAVESTTRKSGSNSVFNPLMRTIIALSVLIFIVMVALGIWFMLKRNTKTEAESLSSQGGEDTIYYNVTKGPVPHQNPCADNEILYSQVSLITKQSPNQQVQVQEEDVVYSTLAHR